MDEPWLLTDSNILLRLGIRAHPDYLLIEGCATGFHQGWSLKHNFKARYSGSAMCIIIELPDDIAQHEDPARDALEALTIEGFRSGSLSSYQARTLLGLTRFEFDAFLVSHDVWEHSYGFEELEKDRETLKRLDNASDLASPVVPS